MPEPGEAAGSGSEQGETFRVSFPDPPLAGAPGKDVVFWAADSESSGGREYEDLMMRRVPAHVAHRFRGAAGARGFTHAQYLSALVGLHEEMRQRADGGDAEVRAVLDRLRLSTVSI
jgi:hypothetical protein